MLAKFLQGGATERKVHQVVQLRFILDGLDSGSYILAAHVEEFERAWAARCEAPWAVGVSSGTDALALALRAVGVGPGDEVLVPAMTATALAEVGDGSLLYHCVR